MDAKAALCNRGAPRFGPRERGEVQHSSAQAQVELVHADDHAA